MSLIVHLEDNGQGFTEWHIAPEIGRIIGSFPSHNDIWLDVKVNMDTVKEGGNIAYTIPHSHAQRQLLHRVIKIEEVKSSVELVAEFHKVFDHPIAPEPCVPPMDRVKFRIGFMREELNELEKACEEGNLIELADGLGDIRYVLDGFYLEAGLHNLQEDITREIHRSNMSKSCATEEEAIESARILNGKHLETSQVLTKQVGDRWLVYRESDTKVLKPITYFRPSLDDVIWPIKF